MTYLLDTNAAIASQKELPRVLHHVLLTSTDPNCESALEY